MHDEALRIEGETAAELSLAPAPRWILAGVLAMSVVLGGCARDSSAKTNAAAPTPSSSGSEPEVLATIGDEQITMTDVHSRVGETLDKVETQYQRSRSKLIDSTLQAILRDRVLLAEAKKQGKTVDELVAAEAGAPLEPTDVEVNAWYQENRARIGNRTLEQVRPQIVAYLREQRRKDAMTRLEARLDKDFKVTLNFEPYRLTFDNTGAPTLGAAGAPVTVVEFSDFQCPYCQGFAPILKRIEQQYGDKVLIVYRQYPIPSLHPNAFKAAEASLCANEQGKFWDLHDVMFAEQQQLSVSDLKEKARRLGMNSKKFDGCLDSGRYVEQVQNDQKDGLRAGINGTPAVFVNGIQVEGGAVPFETIASIINRELARADRSK
jgi:protein-disulfide isomerase